VLIYIKVKYEEYKGEKNIIMTIYLARVLAYDKNSYKAYADLMKKKIISTEK
jgi:hypothetical protein